jgi:hypothetical protein
MCRERRRQGHPQKPAYALVAAEDARLQLVRRCFHLFRELEDLIPRVRQAIAGRQLLEHVRPETLLQLGDAAEHVEWFTLRRSATARTEPPRATARK